MNPQSSGVDALVLLGPGVGRSARRLPGPSPAASDALASSMQGLPVAADFSGPDAGRRMSPAPPAEAPIPVIPQDVVRAAEKNGYEAGFAQGHAAAQRELAIKLSRLEQLLASIAQKRDDLLEVLEEDIVELALEAAAAVVGNSVLAPDYPLEAVRRALNSRTGMRILSVRVSPADFDLVAVAAAEGSLELPGETRLVADADIRLGGCVIETGQGSLDARVEMQLEKLRAAIHDGYSHRSVTAGPTGGSAGDTHPPSA